METIALDDPETQIADVAVKISTFAKSNQKTQLRKALSELASLKAKRSPSIIYQLDCEKGFGDSA